LLPAPGGAAGQRDAVSRTHGDLQVAHVFVDGDEITGVVDWSEAGSGDALYDLASLTLGHQEHLGDVIAGYGTDVDLDVIRAWWSLRCLRAVRWLVEHGFDPSSPGCEVDVLRSLLPLPDRLPRHHGARRCRSLGNSVTSLMFSARARRAVHRSSPIANPPCGGMP
jgi:Phosphotransferase enzyme family